VKLPDGPPQVRGISIAHARNLYGYVSDPLGFVARRFETYGDPYLAKTGGELLFVFKHPEHLAEILVRKADAFVKEEFGLEKVLGRGLLTSEGELWRHRRRMIQPAFSQAALRRYGQVMVEEAEVGVDRWRDGQPVDVSAEMTRVTLAIVARALFSHRIRAQTDTVSRAMSRFQESVGTFDLLPDWMPTPKHLRTRRSIDDMNRLVYGVIDERHASRAHGEPASGDLLDALLDTVSEGDQPPLSEDREGLRDELLTLYMAGHETTANATSWAWYLLARHPEIDARLHAELDAVLGDAPASVDSLAQLPYLRAVCQEVLRLYPPAYVLARRTTREVTIGEWTIPANQPTVLWIYMTHRDPRWYPDPERFDPRRFLDDSAAKRPRLAWLPFGAGARMCIGKHFALMEMQLVLATVLRRFRFEMPHRSIVKPRPRVTLTPAGGVHGTLRARA
jgi:cytochrome P450